MAFPSGWLRKQQISILAAQVDGSGDHLDFPMLITLEHLNGEIVDQGLYSALNGGGDIRFSSDANGQTQLACEIQTFVTNATPNSRRCEIWVKVPSLSTSINTDIYVWYNKIGESQPATTNTYGRNAVWSGYNLVSHDGITDSTGNGTITHVNSPTVGANNPFGGASTAYNGTTQYAHYDITSWGLTGNITVMGWLKAISGGDDYAPHIHMHNNDGWIGIGDRTGDGGNSYVIYGDTGTNSNADGLGKVTSGTTYNTWEYVVAKQTSLTAGREMRVEKIDHNNGTSGWIAGVNNGRISFGADTANNIQTGAEQSEIWITVGTLLSDDYTDTVYNNQNDPETFASAGIPEYVEDDLATWGRKQKITIQASQVSGSVTHTDFPVLITLDHLSGEIVDAGSRGALNGGGDIRFSADSGGINQIACEVVTFVTDATPTNRKCEIWTKVPSLSTLINTDIYVWYNKPAQMQPIVTRTYGKNAVWVGDSARWHFNELAGNITDATGNGNFGIEGTEGSGSVIYNGDNIAFDGDVYFDVIHGENIDLSGGAYSIDFVIDIPTQSNSYAAFFGKGDYGNSDWTLQRDNVSNNMWMDHNGDNPTFTGLWSEFAGQGIKYAAITWNGINTISIYIDGVLFETNTDQSTSPSHTSGDFLHIGASRDYDEMEINGYYELGINNTGEHNADWIKTKYNTQASPSTFAVTGLPEDAVLGDLSTWGRKQKITIQASQVSGSVTHTDFPVLITLDHLDGEIIDTGVNSALNGGGDLRFSTDILGTTQLACEVVTFATDATPANRKCEIWIKVPSLSASINTDIYIWYKKVGQTQPAVTNAYGRNAVWLDYVCVLHLNESGDGTSGEYIDSSGGGLFGRGGNGTSSNVPVSEPENHPYGGTWQHFDGSNDYIAIENSAGITHLSDFTVSALVRRDAAGDGFDEAIISSRTTSVATNAFSLQEDNGGFRCVNADGIEEYITSTDSSVGVAKLRSISSDDTGWRCFSNGSTPITSSNQRQHTNPLDIYIGRYFDNNASRRWDGNIGEVRLKLSSDGVDRHTTEYNNIFATNTFALAGTPEVGSEEALNIQNSSNNQIADNVVIEGLPVADLEIQHIQTDVSNSGSTNSNFNAVASLNNVLEISNNNRKSHGGRADLASGNLEGDDMAGGHQLTSVDTLTYYRESGSISSNMRFDSSLMEYVGPVAGANEFIVRGRFQTVLNGASNSVTETLTDVLNAGNCIPFITGIMNNATTDDSDSGTTVAYLENNTTLRVQKGSNGNNVAVYITVVEFTGINWNVLTGDSGNVSADAGTITLYNGSDGTGTATNVSAWSEAMVFGHHRGDTDASGTNDAIADNWPVYDVGTGLQSVDWTFDANHDSAGTNRHFVHILTHPDINVTRYQDTSSTAGETTIDISSASLSSIDQTLIVGSSISSGSGTAFGRGWRNYYLNSTIEAAHWCHRSGNTMAHEIQIVDLSALSSSASNDIDLIIVGDGIVHLVDGMTLSQNHSLLMNDGQHSYSSDHLALGLNVLLDLLSGLNQITSENLNLELNSVLVVEDSNHNITSESPTLQEVAALAIAGSGHGVYSDELTINQIHDLEVQGTTHQMLSENVVLIEGIGIDPSDGAFNLTSEVLSLSENKILSVNSSVNSCSADSIQFSQFSEINISQAHHLLQSNNIQLEALLQLEITPSVHGFLSDGFNIGYSVGLIISGVRNDHFSQHMNLNQNHVASIINNVHSIISNELLISTLIESEIGSHSVLSDYVNLEQIHHLELSEIYHPQIAGEPYVRVPVGIWATVGEVLTGWSNQSGSNDSWNVKGQNDDVWDEKNTGNNNWITQDKDDSDWQ